MDALEIARNAEVSATVALTKIAAHEVSCERRYQEQASVMREVRDDVKELAIKLAEVAHAPLREADTRTWAIKIALMQLLGTGMVLAALKLFKIG